jgi:CheY-like chemotaxis protein
VLEVRDASVLVVDDDPLVLDLMEEILRIGGYDVVRRVFG